MKKLLVVFGSLALLFVIALIAAGFFLGSIVKAAVNRFGPPLTKTKVELAHAEIFPLTGSGSIQGLLIGNPPGWHSSRAVYLGQARIAIKPFSLLGDHVVIEEILIDQPEFVYETRIVGSNLKDLLKNIQASTAGGSDSAEPAAEKPGKPVRFEVRRFRLQNAKVTIGVGKAAMTVPMPTITLDDLGTKGGGITASQLTGVVMEKVLSQVLMTAASAVGQVSKSAGSAATDATVNAAKQAVGGLKKVFGGKD
jgi:uncharacterized protein involved in outer membrane biogenesis